MSTTLVPLVNNYCITTVLDRETQPISLKHNVIIDSPNAMAQKQGYLASTMLALFRYIDIPIINTIYTCA